MSPMLKFLTIGSIGGCGIFLAILVITDHVHGRQVQRQGQALRADANEVIDCYNKWTDVHNQYGEHQNAYLSSTDTTEKRRQLEQCADVLDNWTVPTNDATPAVIAIEKDMSDWRAAARALVTGEVNALGTWSGNPPVQLSQQETAAEKKLNDWQDYCSKLSAVGQH